MGASGAGSVDVRADGTPNARSLDDAYAACFSVGYKVKYRIPGQGVRGRRGLLPARGTGAGTAAVEEPAWPIIPSHGCRRWRAGWRSTGGVTRCRAGVIPMDGPDRNDEFTLERVDLVRALGPAASTSSRPWW